MCTVRLDLDTRSTEATRRLLDLASKIDSGRFILAAYPHSLAVGTQTVGELLLACAMPGVCVGWPFASAVDAPAR